MFNTVFSSFQRLTIKLLSSTIIIVGLFSFAPIANATSATPVGNQTEQLITSGGEKVFRFYQTISKPVLETTIIHKAIQKSYNTKIAVQHLRNKVNIFSLDQRSLLRHFTQNHSDREDYFLSQA